MQGHHLGCLLALARLHTPEAPLSIVSHEESVAAWEKQEVLPPGVLVQKSLTLLLGSQLVLLSGVGDFRVERWHLHTIARLLSLSATEGKNGLINPSWFSAETTAGMAEGMVSPFFPPAFATKVPFAAVVLLPPPSRLALNDRAAISLSLSRSLLFPAHQLQDLIVAYGLRYYPHIPVLRLPRPALTLVEMPPVPARRHERLKAAATR